MNKSKYYILYLFSFIWIRKPLRTTIFLLKSLFHQIRNIVKNPDQIESLTDSQKAYAWENAVFEIVSSNQSLDHKPHGLPAPLVISLTSYSLRFSTLPLTLISLLSQTIKPDKILLWIAYEDKERLTQDILNLRKQCIEIKFCPDIGSYKKIIPTLQNYPDHFIVTSDDDCYYWPTWLEELIAAWSGSKQDIVAHIVHRIRLNENQRPIEYYKWCLDDHNAQDASPLNFATGVGGVFYPPGTFHPDVVKVDVFQQLCKKGDDIWLYWMSRLNGSMVRRVNSKKRFLNWPGTQEKTLFNDNFMKGNDEFIKAMIGAYGFPGEIGND